VSRFQLSLDQYKSTDPQTEGVTVGIIDVTPALAEELLKANRANRKLKKHPLEQHVEAMKLGDWLFNGDAIRIAKDGRLLDGQHRLLSVIESGVTIPVILVQGLTDHSQMTMDIGVKRTYSDHLSLQGEVNCKALAGTVRCFFGYNSFYGRDRWPDHGVRGSMAQFDRLLEEHPGLREATQIAGAMRKKFSVSNAGLGVAYYVLDRIDREDSDFFWERLSNGDGLSHEDSTQPILKLREYLHKEEDEMRKVPIALAAIFKAWNAYRLGRAISAVKPRLGGKNPEKFPWPK
jgi:hypothetical protein